jgi:diguanylate cyclase (GGDEF)-like protein/PAS domain S-box-containing protein
MRPMNHALPRSCSTAYSLRQWLMCLVLATALPMVVLLGYHIYRESTLATDRAQRLVRSMSEVAVTDTLSFLLDQERVMSLIAQRPLVRAADPLACDPSFDGLVKLRPYLTNIATVDTQGWSVCSVLKSLHGERRQIGKPAWLTRVLERNAFVTGTVQTGIYTGHLILMLAYPVRDDQGAVKGALAFVVDLTAFNPVIPTTLGADLVTSIIDHDGMVIARSADAEKYVGKNMRDLPIYQRVQKQKQGTGHSLGEDGIDRLYGFAPIGKTGWTVLSSVSTAYVQADGNQSTWPIALLGLAIVVMSSGLVVVISRKIIHPVTALQVVVQRVYQGELGQRAAVVGGVKEIAEAGLGLNAMLDQLSVARQQLQESETQYRMLFDASPDAIRVILQNQVVLFNQPAMTLFGITEREGVNKCSIVDLIALEFHDEVHERLSTAVRDKQYVLPVERVLHMPDGSLRHVEASFVPFEYKGQSAALSILRDISLRKQAEAMIWQQANTDMLTGLPNRRMLRDRLVQGLKRCKRHNTQLAVLFIDLDMFKEVNDTLGHDNGDLLLIETARRISALVRETDTVARQGGDEFTVIVLEHDAVRLEQIAINIIASLAQPFQLGEDQAFITASVGCIVFPDDALTPEDLFKGADQALYAAKAAGRNRISYFTPELQAKAQSRMRLTNDLRSALLSEQLVIHYQPIVDLVDGSIYKAEALIRWKHPKLGLVSPAEFIPLAESSGLIIEIGDWVFKQSALQVLRWRALFHAEFQISVNKSPMQFTDDGRLQADWFAHLQHLNLPGQSMVVEITEGLLLASRIDVMAQLEALRNAGIGVSLDDFGTGYSSLSYLQKYPIDYVKIDQSFVRNLVPGSKDLALCKAIIVMAHELGMKVIAEGVETTEQCRLLMTAGCDFGQGYFFSRPVPATDFEALRHTFVLPMAASVPIST